MLVHYQDIVDFRYNSYNFTFEALQLKMCLESLKAYRLFELFILLENIKRKLTI